MRAPPRSRLPSAVIGLCLAFFLPWLTLQIAARSGHEPSRALMAGVSPWAVQLSVPAPERHRYPASAWERALQTEAQELGAEVEPLRALGDALAREVAWWMVAEARRGELREAERVLWEAGQGERLLRKIAEVLHRRGIRVTREPVLLSRAHTEGRIDLDADALVLLVLHLGYRLDLDLYAALAPRSLFIRYQGPTDAPPLFLDPHRFSGSTLHRDVVGHTPHRPTTTGAAPEALIQAAELDAPRDLGDLHDAILTRLTLSLVAADLPVDAEALLAPRLAHTRDHRLVQLLHAWRLSHARAALAEGRPEDAARHAALAIQGRASHPALHRDEGIDERIVMDEAMQQLRQNAAARGALDRAIARGEGAAVCEVLRPLGEELTALLPACG